MKTHLKILFGCALIFFEGISATITQAQQPGNTRVYCYIVAPQESGLPEGPAWFYLDQPGTLTSLAATSSSWPILGGTWADGIWYGSEPS